jgi:predicted kinase
MKTTVDLSPSLLREAKRLQPGKGRTLRDFVAEALHEKLRAHRFGEKLWMKPLARSLNCRKKTAGLRKSSKTNSK